MNAPVLLHTGLALLLKLFWIHFVLRISGAIGSVLYSHDYHPARTQSHAFLQPRLHPSASLGRQKIYSDSALFSDGRKNGQDQRQEEGAGGNTRLSLLQQMCDDTTPQLQHESWDPKNDPLLSVQDLRAVATEDGSPILNGVSFEVGVGEVHAIMGRNGSGK